MTISKYESEPNKRLTLSVREEKKPEIENPDHEEGGEGFSLRCISIELTFSKKSYVDSKIIITCKSWAISMLIKNETLSQHTILIIEGGKEKEIKGVTKIRHFWQQFDLRGPSTINNWKTLKNCFSGHGNKGMVAIGKEKYEDEDLKKNTLSMNRYRPYRKTWSASAEKIEEMIKMAEYQREHPEEVRFNFTGKNSFLAPKTLTGIVDKGSILKNYSKYNAKELNHYVAIYQERVMRNDTTYQVRTLIGTVLVSAFICFSAEKAMKLTIEQTGKFVKEGMERGFRGAPVTIYPQKIIRFLCALPSLMNGLKTLQVNVQGWLYKPHMERIEEHAREKLICSQNCFTWAREMAAMANPDVLKDIPEIASERVGVLPSSRLPNQESISNEEVS